MREWRDTTLGEVVDFKAGWRNSRDASLHGRYPFYTCSQEVLRHDSWDFEGEYVVMAGNNADARFHLHFARGRFAARQRTYIMAPKSGNLDVRFLYYALRQLQPLFSAQAQGTTTKFVTAPILSNAPLSVPPIGQQRRIAGILGALDDKIELNRQMANTLEGLARASYADLLADGEGDWPPGSIADVAFNPRDQVDPTQVDPATPYIGLEHVPRGRMVLGEWGQAAAAESGKMAFRQNDILFGKLRPYFRKVGVVSTSGICSTDIIVIRPRRVEDLGYVLAVATDGAFIEASNAASTGTRMPRTSWTELVRYPLPIPPPSARAAFTKRVWPLIERAQAAVFETRTLQLVRDTLLPRLLSGDIEIAA